MLLDDWYKNEQNRATDTMADSSEDGIKSLTYLGYMPGSFQRSKRDEKTTNPYMRPEKNKK